MPTDRAHTCADVIDPWAVPVILGGVSINGDSSALHTQHNNIELQEGTWRAHESPEYGTMWHGRSTYMPYGTIWHDKGTYMTILFNMAPYGMHMSLPVSAHMSMHKSIPMSIHTSIHF